MCVQNTLQQGRQGVKGELTITHAKKRTLEGRPRVVILADTQKALFSRRAF